ncbi:MAG TPA: prolyl oligopeptidase family serine peptidase [Candidatus Bathyarchaeia archaeon]|nr:prolyl oligopeptidase family serine peptidase [Candidatus Bathyarchaeia archaeon]
MDIHQLRSWIFELYEPLENERQYIVYDEQRGNLLIDAPPFSERALRLVRGAGPASLLVATNAARAADAAKYRQALGLQVAVHADDADRVPGGADLVLGDDELVRPDARAIRVAANGEGATVLLLHKAGGVLVCGDLDLASDAARTLIPLNFSVVLSARRSPMWNAGKDNLLALQDELPKPRKQFGILLQAPWDRAYKGRLEDKLVPHDPIVPREVTAPREAAMGPETLVVATAARELVERPRRPVGSARASAAGESEGVRGPAAAVKGAKRPKSFAEDWNARGSPRPPTTIANPETDIQPPPPVVTPRSIGDRYRRLSVEELAGVPYVDYIWGGVDLSPDGSEAAFSWNRSGTFEIYSVPLQGEQIFQLTDAKERSVWPRWSADARQLAFLRDRGGDERFDVWLVDRDGERERNLTNEPGVMHRDIAWSPDGTKIAYAANAGGKAFAIHVIDVGTGAKRALTDGARDDMQPRWSPDGTLLVFWSRRETTRTNADLYVVASTGGDTTRLETRDGKDGESIDPQWSPDGTRISFTTDTRGRQEIALASYAEREVRRIEHMTDSIHDEYGAVWRPDGRALAYLHNEDAAVSLRRVFAVSHADHAVSDIPGMHAAPDIGPDSDTTAFLFSSASRPWDVFVTRERATEARALTRSLPATIDPATLVEPSHIRYPSAGGDEVPALLFLPYAEALRGEKIPPAIINIHGGPTSQHHREWNVATQVFVNAGFVVLEPNPRGSTGYGKAWREANRHDWGGEDLEDIERGAAWLGDQKLADPARIGVYGGSYGGYLTLMSLALRPDRFAAGVSAVGIVSWKTMAETTRGDLRDYLLREFGDPIEDAELYRERSPLTHASKIRAPLLILQGENDPRVPRTEAEQVVKALRDGGKTHEYHVYPGEGHGFRVTENRIDSLRRALDWFERHLRQA